MSAEEAAARSCAEIIFQMKSSQHQQNAGPEQEPLLQQTTEQPENANTLNEEVNKDSAEAIEVTPKKKSKFSSRIPEEYL